MFRFLQDMDNYNTRKVDKYKDEEANILVSTARISDSTEPFETAIEHPLYNGGKIIIVETYVSIEEAKKGHKKWLEIILDKEHLPDVLYDRSLSEIANLRDLSDNGWREKRKYVKEK